MERDTLWNAFAKSGKVEDYLRYVGVEVYTGGENSVAEGGESPDENHNRRTDCAGKQ